MRAMISLMPARYSLVLAASIAFAQSPLPRTTFEEQPATLLSSGAIDLTVLDQGATMADLVFTGDREKLSPLWNPRRMSRGRPAYAPGCPAATSGRAPTRATSVPRLSVGLRVASVMVGWILPRSRPGESIV